MYVRSNIKLSPYCIGFRQTMVEGESRTFTAHPSLPFKIRGLMVWGATNQSKLTCFQIGSELCLQCSADPIPLRFFETGLSFRDFELLLDLEDDSDISTFFQCKLKDNPRVSRRQLFDLPPAHAALSIKLSTIGPIEALVMWGLCAIS